MSFHTYDVALELLRTLREPLRVLERRDKPLAAQLGRAGASTVLNIAEASQRVGKDRTHLFRVALGSVTEVRAALDVAEALGHFGHQAEAHELIGRVRAMLWRPTR